jgi:hypothetical protein
MVDRGLSPVRAAELVTAHADVAQVHAVPPPGRAGRHRHLLDRQPGAGGRPPPDDVRPSAAPKTELWGGGGERGKLMRRGALQVGVALRLDPALRGRALRLRVPYLAVIAAAQCAGAAQARRRQAPRRPPQVPARQLPAVSDVPPSGRHRCPGPNIAELTENSLHSETRAGIIIVRSRYLDDAMGTTYNDDNKKGNRARKSE